MSGGFDAGAPAADRAFDAGAILGLAIAHAGKFEAAAIRDSIRKVTEPGGEVVYAGPQGFARALQLIKEKKPVRYVGVIGAVQFDKNGDIVGPFRTWRITNGEVVTVGQMSHGRRDGGAGEAAEVSAPAVTRPAAHAAGAGAGDLAHRHRPVAGGRHGARRQRCSTRCTAQRDLADYAAAGFDTFDMADHYGSAEVITGTLLASPRGRGVRAFTKWCPQPGPMTAAVVRDGVQRALDRLRVERIDLMQFHWWSFEHPGYLDAMLELAKLREEGLIAHLGLTNFDTAHLRVLLAQGVPIASNQVCLSLLDRRATEDDVARCAWSAASGCWPTARWAAASCSERWLGAAEPAEVADWSKMKYRRFIDAVGGWAALQGVLRAAPGHRREARRVAVQRGHALGAGAAGGGGGDRRRAAGRIASTAPTTCGSSASRSTPTTWRCLDAAFAATQPHPRRLRRRVPHARRS